MTDRRLRLALVATAAVGVGVAGYLTYIHYAGIDPFCSAISDCERVQSSEWATVGGLPVALLGLLGYVALMASVWLRREEGRAVTAYFAYVAVGFSAYLTYLELFEIHAICQWCAVSAVIALVLAVLATMRALRPATPAPQ